MGTACDSSKCINIIDNVINQCIIYSGMHQRKNETYTEIENFTHSHEMWKSWNNTGNVILIVYGWCRYMDGGYMITRNKIDFNSIRYCKFSIYLLSQFFSFFLVMKQIRLCLIWKFNQGINEGIASIFNINSSLIISMYISV